MVQFDQVLVVEGSRVVRDLLRRLMRRHSNGTRATDHCDKAREMIEGEPAPTLVIVDRDAPAEGGLALLEFVATRSSHRPEVLLIGRGFSTEDETRARHLGAVACLRKPVSFHAIVRAMRAAEARPFVGVAPRLYARPPARAHLLDTAGGESQIVWNLHDLSVTGALLDTRGAIPLGTHLALQLVLDDERVGLEAEVVRVQEPSWETLPGVAVRFVALGARERRRIAAHLERAGVEPR